ncbi:MAG: universal stress protein [Desulfopila sp.]
MEEQKGNILFATDLSVNMHKVFEEAAKMAIRYDAKVTILHVLATAPESKRQLMSIFNDDQYADIRRQHQEQARQVLTGKNTEARKIQQALTKVFFEQEQQMNVAASDDTFINKILIAEGGSVADEIYTVAVSEDCQYIVLGCHRQGFIAEAFGDKILRKILKKSTIPVLVVPFAG